MTAQTGRQPTPREKRSRDAVRRIMTREHHIKQEADGTPSPDANQPGATQRLHFTRPLLDGGQGTYSAAGGYDHLCSTRRRGTRPASGHFQRLARRFSDTGARLGADRHDGQTRDAHHSGVSRRAERPDFDRSTKRRRANEHNDAAPRHHDAASGEGRAPRRRPFGEEDGERAPRCRV